MCILVSDNTKIYCIWGILFIEYMNVLRFYNVSVYSYIWYDMCLYVQWSSYLDWRCNHMDVSALCITLSLSSLHTPSLACIYDFPTILPSFIVSSSPNSPRLMLLFVNCATLNKIYSILLFYNVAVRWQYHLYICLSLTTLQWGRSTIAIIVWI